tara:strand:- start:266 stop:1294 length:1029 start_codon:yes stop_codon:yes gene_type:complete
MTTGRTGSDYLAGCLDGVKNVMTFSGKFNYQIYFKNDRQIIKKEVLISKFIKGNKRLFNYDKIENLNLNIEIKKFKKFFLKKSTNYLNRKEFLIKLYEAYHLTLNRKLVKSNIIVHHSHTRDETNNFLKDFPKAKLLVTIRDPRANLKSGLENWWRLESKRKNLQHSFMYLRRIRNDLNYALKRKNKKKFIKLELMGIRNYKRSILKFIGVKYDNKINISTFANKPWNGDKLSNFKEKIKGKFNKNIIYNGWQEFFSEDDLILLNFLYSNYKKFYDIEKIHITKKIYLFFRSVFLFKFELRSINNQSILSIKFIKNLIYYFLRVVYIQFLILNIDLLNEKKN